MLMLIDSTKWSRMMVIVDDVFSGMLVTVTKILYTVDVNEMFWCSCKIIICDNETCPIPTLFDTDLDALARLDHSFRC